MDHESLVVLGCAEHLAVELQQPRHRVPHLLNGLTPRETVQQAFDPWHGIVSTTRAQQVLGFRPHYPSAWAAAVSGVL
ncbi:hypothetical protein [Lentzea aerocolonigenes]|uniref:hypothetical protein n=1 Tax=Lentzea aerocolonigenes TaxID=68170 RepID=UPI0004C35339|nr:hypothetical protein [Lentzea aerocolonigenes]MCP2250001.1 hypothetical protein [Lentzea aerocolonigenes]